jgi:hypothetical protein
MKEQLQETALKLASVASKSFGPAPPDFQRD